MNKKTKRIFAREFLILFGSTVLVLVGILLMYFIDSYYDNKLMDVQEEIYKVRNELNNLEEKGNYYLSELVIHNSIKIRNIINETGLGKDNYEIKFLYALLQNENLLEKNILMIMESLKQV